MGKKGKVRMSGVLRAKLEGAVRKGRRETIYKMKLKKHDGVCPCFVCGRHVEEQYATLEHVVRLSEGGTDDMDNLDISHNKCNWNRDRIENERRERNGESHGDGHTAVGCERHVGSELHDGSGAVSGDGVSEGNDQADAVPVTVP